MSGALLLVRYEALVDPRLAPAAVRDMYRFIMGPAVGTMSGGGGGGGSSRGGDGDADAGSSAASSLVAVVEQETAKGNASSTAALNKKQAELSEFRNNGGSTWRDDYHENEQRRIDRQLERQPLLAKLFGGARGGVL